MLADSSAAAGRRLEFVALSKRYGSIAALDAVSLDIAAGEFVTLLGPSGSGKTTLLMTAAGFTQPDGGRVRIDGNDITDLPPERRGFGMVFQGYALFPHLSVAENIAFPLAMRRVAKSAIATHVERVLDLVQLTQHRDKLPRQLSGGQQQRTALARALVFKPGILLLDEPLSALDKALREELQWEMKALHRSVGTTFVNVTHDQLEALALSDRIVVMRDGRVVESGRPQALYDTPQTRFVAAFLGSATFLDGVVCGVEGDVVHVRVGERVFRHAEQHHNSTSGSTITISLRPERFTVSRSTCESDNTIAGTVAEAIYAGSNLKLKVDVPQLGRVTVSTAAQGLQFDHGDAVVLGWAANAGVSVRNN